MMFKRIFLMILVATVLLGCNKETTLTASVDSNFIAFDSPTTRAGLSDVQKDGFGVWALFYNEAQQSGYWLLDNKYVYQTASGWSYDDPQRWINNSVFCFFASYPQYAGFQKITRTENGELRKYVALVDYETPQSADEDILVASTFVDTSTEYNTTVPIVFNHLFTKINVRVKQNQGTNENDNFIVDKISLKNVKGKGTCLIFVSENPVWEYDNNSKMTFTKQFSGDNILGLNGEALLSENGLLLLPQSIQAGTIEVEIRFRVGLAGNEDISTYETETYNAYLPSTVNWEFGKSITYTALLSTYNPITFDPPTIESWGGLQSGGTIIIK